MDSALHLHKHRLLKRFGAAMLALSIGACGQQPTPGSDILDEHIPESDRQQEEAPRSYGIRGTRPGDAAVPMLHDGRRYYVPLQQVAETLGYQYKWEDDGRRFSMGDNDPIFEFDLADGKAVKEQREIPLRDALVSLNGMPYLPLSDFETLFADEARFETQSGKVVFHENARHVQLLSNEAGRIRSNAPEFADDPADPAGRAAGRSSSGPSGHVMRAASNRIDMDRVIAEAKRYLGVEYEFGTGPYSSNNRKFDCSTFTRHVFGKFGVSLPRTAREQAKKGTTVSRNNLRKGDLLYFTVPGRFKDDDTIGHVGIYMGDRQMIHAAPAPENGVQITSIDKPYWKETFVTAKRIVQ